MRALMAAAVLTASLAMVDTGAAEAALACASVPVVAHRGETSRGTENTTKAVLAAWANGAGAEVDLRTTRTGRVMLMHDATVTRTTNGAGRVAELSARKIRTFRTNDGQQVPFAGATLRRLRDTPGARIVLDLKALTGPAQDMLATRIANLGIANRVSAISFYPALLAGFRKRNPGVDTMFIDSRLPTVTRAASYGGVAVYGHLITPQWASAMRARKVPFSLRMANDRSAWNAAGSYAVEFAITDRADAMRAHCA
ncbi:MAG TPA: glycerophosphodiester phosphodiesterase family protein [Nocardioidaceae bacterium]|nr:glycerophosphodiester phosphodiesterase family protein [Nocardioidaceae bacterium]